MFKTMWGLAKSSNPGGVRSKESLIEDVHKEVRSAAPGARLTLILRNNLERLDKAERKEIVSALDGGGGPMEGCAPLFIACKKGNLEIVEYLIEVCGADVEQKGIYEVIDDKTAHRVSPLWCAAVAGRLNIVKCLVKHGANVNSVSDTGSTPVRSACFMTNYEVVQYLVEHAGADIQLPNYNGGTCLINSVQSSQLCEYLLSHGAKVNSQDIQLKTALHYAIQEHRFETTKLLLANGADPFLKNRYGDDALQTSCLKGAILIFNFLLENIPSYTAERRAEMHELMGSTFLDEHHDIQMALHFWRKAIEIRSNASGNIVIPKPPLGYIPLYARIKAQDGTDIEVKEFVTREDLDAISTDLDQIRINSLLIAERILIKSHKDVIFRIMYRGAAYADSSQYLFCIRLWRYALQLRIQRDTLLYADTCFTALALIRLYLDLDANRELNRESPFYPLQVDDLLGTFRLLVDNLPPCASLVKVRPVFKRQQESFDRGIRCCTHLIYLLLKASKTVEQMIEFKKLTEKVVRYDLRMCSNGDTLLHQAVCVNNVVRSHFFVDDHQVCVFPSVEVTKFLLDCGADVNATNHNRQTPLHYVAPKETFNLQIVDLLLENGAHADQLDNQNHSALEILQSRARWFEFSPLQHLTLKCIASRAVCLMGMNFNPGDLPRELEQFVELHRPTQLDDVQQGSSAGTSTNKNNNTKPSKQPRANH